MKTRWKIASLLLVSGLLITGYSLRAAKQRESTLNSFDRAILNHSAEMITEGRRTCRFDPFGDEAFWGNRLQLHQAIEGANFGG
jgi:hypothetical protein